jgi:hypothetical protein
LSVMRERDFADPPQDRAPGVEHQAVVVAFRLVREGNGGMDLTAGTGHAARLAELIPVPAVIGAEDGYGPLLVVGLARHDGAVDIQTVDLRQVVSGDLKLDPYAAAALVDGSYPVMIEKQLALVLWQDALCACGDGNPPRQARVDDSVGYKLGGEVVIVAARLIGGTVKREVAVGG